MNQLPRFASPRARAAASPGTLIALCLVLLQLVTALHFALIPHGFNAGLSGFVHVHAPMPSKTAVPSRLKFARAASQVAVLIGEGASCASDACPLGFAGHHSVSLGESTLSALVAQVITPAPALPSSLFSVQGRALLAAPKTSPPV